MVLLQPTHIYMQTGPTHINRPAYTYIILCANGTRQRASNKIAILCSHALDRGMSGWRSTCNSFRGNKLTFNGVNVTDNFVLMIWS